MGYSVKEWLKYDGHDEELPKLFYNMSATLKYIHSNDYYIRDFNISDININNEETLSPIEYKNIEKMETIEDKEKIPENIHTLALLQLAAYSKTLAYFNPTFAEQNFQEFELFIPEEDIPYLRGAIQRRSPVYYCDFVNARNQREIERLEKETGGVDSSIGGMSKSKSTAIGRAMTDKETERLYKNTFTDGQSGLTTFLILPLTMILLGVILSILTILFP